MDTASIPKKLPDVRRIFLGVMPSGSGYGKVEVSAQIQSLMARRIHDLQDNLERAHEVIREATGLSLD